MYGNILAISPHTQNANYFNTFNTDIFNLIPSKTHNIHKT